MPDDAPRPDAAFAALFVGERTVRLRQWSYCPFCGRRADARDAGVDRHDEQHVSYFFHRACEMADAEILRAAREREGGE